MSPEAQRIAIAEACGWKRIGTQKNLPFYGWIEVGPCEEIPDYLNDLNAMHEAEKMLNQSGTWQYAANLGRVVGQNLMKDIREHGEWMIAHATAAQRAEAFLRTIGKWEDDK